ncbi:sensor histidine kinase [Actinoplanes sp. NEAU-A12]|uniref:histidine kinase n=1 Tax=Actinoplanes sandaracinus TaxID=3045177 RepID=A0ABT6WM92_9ACTN|nr:sensor histidine kinase [Actinoplanes sandaracinus]MDI6100816.1 sensor histidine kinase [Actinoplanes sandaracinus]
MKFARPALPRLTDRPIRTKLALLITPTVLVILVLSGVIGYGAAAAASRADEARRLVGLSLTAGELAAALQRERAAAGLVFARRSGPETITAYREATLRTDAVLARYPGGPAGALPSLREQVRGGREVPASLVLFRYRTMIADLTGYRAGMGQLNVDTGTSTRLRAVAGLSDSIEALGRLQVTVLPALAAGRLTAIEQQQVVASAAAHADNLEGFRRLSPPAWEARLDAQPGSPAVTDAERLQALAANSPPGADLTWAVPPEQWTGALGARMDQLHAVERSLDAELVRAVTAERDDQHREILLLAAAVLFCLVVPMAAGWWITRSMTRSLRALTHGAAATATTLPTVVARLTAGRPDPAAAAELVEQAGQAIAVTGRDEIGEVARAFNHVSRTAVSLAADQAQLQAVIATVMEAIARQLQRQGQRVMAAIDALEQDEEDPDRLRRLFELDQRATGIQRLIANLFVFAGGRAGQPARRPIPLADVVKAAISRVHNAYDQVDDARVETSVLIVPEHAEEIVHVLTELVDNAVRFSAPGSPVRVEAHHVGDRVHIQVSDDGMGIPESRLPYLMDRLATFRLDAETARHMGLPVVGRIAARLGLDVALRSAGAGTRADVIVPGVLFTVGPAHAPAAPPPWPPPAPGTPLRIFEEVAHPYFHHDAARPALPAAWASASAAASTLADAPPPRRRTAHGLPVRVPGEYALPAVEPPAPASAAPPRDRSAAARGMAAFAASARLSRSTPTQIGPR